MGVLLMFGFNLDFALGIVAISFWFFLKKPKDLAESPTLVVTLKIQIRVLTSDKNCVGLFDAILRDIRARTY